MTLNQSSIVLKTKEINFRPGLSEIEIYYNVSDNTINFKINDEEKKYRSNEIESKNNKISSNSYDFIIECQTKEELDRFLSWLEKMKKKNESPEATFLTNLFRTAFQNEFIDNKNILMKLNQYIQSCFTKWSQKDIYAPIAVVCQSSGYGKSKSLYEYAQNNLTTFICLRAPNEYGYPPRSQLANTLIVSFETNHTSKFLIALVEASIEFYRMIVEQHPYFNMQQIADEFRKYQPWLESSTEFTKKDNSIISFNSRVNELMTTIKEIDQNKLKTLKESFNKTIKSITVVIDEAHVLTNSFLNDRSYFLELRSAVRDLFENTEIVFVMTSTNASIIDFNLSELQITNSQRVTNKPNFPPFTKLVYCDQLKSISYEEDIKKAYTEKKNLYEFINKRNPTKTIFYYGRPIWCSINSANNTNVKQDILDLAKVKLIRANSWSDTQLNKTYASLAILASTTNVLNNIAIVNHNLTTNLISGYMATLFHSDEKCNVLFYRYVSETILAEAAACYLTNDSCLKEILKNFHESLVSSNILSTGNIGELVAEIIFLLAKYRSSKIERKTYLSSPILVQSFLLSLLGKNNFKKVSKEIKENFLDGIISFNHFNQKLDILWKDDVLNDFIIRCAAGRFKEQFPQYDYFIPFIFDANEIGLILIQVKNRIDLESTGSLEKLADELDYKIFAKKRKSKYYTNIKLNEKNTLKILINFGTDFNTCFFSSEKKTLIISSLSSFDLDNETKILLKSILNFSRINFDNFEDKDVCRLVSYGCARDYFFQKKQNK